MQPLLYQQAADLYAMLFVQNPDKVALVFSEDGESMTWGESNELELLRSDTVEVILFDESNPQRALKPWQTPELVINSTHPLSCLLEKGAGNNFIEKCQDVYQKKYPKAAPFDSLSLRRCLITSLIKGLHDKSGFVFRGTKETRGLAEQEKLAHCRAVADRVYAVVSEVLESPDREVIYKEADEVLSRLYTQESRRLLRRLVSDSLESSRGDQNCTAATIRSRVKADLKKRFFDPENKEVETLLEEEISSGFAVLEQRKENPSPSPEAYLDSLIKQHWNESCGKRLRDSQEQEASQGVFLSTCKESFSKCFPQEEFSEQAFLKKYIEIASQTLLVSKALHRQSANVLTVPVMGISTLEQLKIQSIIVSQILKSLTRDFGDTATELKLSNVTAATGLSTDSLVRQIVHQKFDELYIDLMKDRAPLLAKDLIARSHAQQKKLGIIFKDTAGVLYDLSVYFPRPVMSHSLRLEIQEIVSLELSKAKSLILLDDYIQNGKEIMPGLVDVTDQLINEFVLNEIINELPTDLLSNIEFRNKIAAYIEDRHRLIKTLKTANRPV